MLELLQIVGAVVVLAAFAASQIGRLDAQSVTYLAANTAGAGLLAVLAVLGHDWGFALLEGAWAAISAVGLCRSITRRRLMRRDAVAQPGP